MTAGSLGLYLPMILSILSTHSTGGLSLATWSLFLLGSSASLVYPLRMGFPLTSFAEYIALAAQSALILSLILAIDDASGFSLPAIGTALAALVALFTWLVTAAPLWTAGVAEKCAMACTTLSLMPQIVWNFQTRSGGGWSPISAFLSASGNAIRIYTTTTVTKDRLILIRFCIGLLLNTILLAQTLVFSG